MRKLTKITSEQILGLRAMKTDYQNVLYTRFRDYTEDQLADLALRQPQIREFIEDYARNSEIDRLKYETILMGKIAKASQRSSNHPRNITKFV